ncbi:MAG: type 4a pilus biogenesis protein PilO [Deltaproteobacteria bacterium]
MLDKGKIEKYIFIIITICGIGYAYYTYVFCGQIGVLQDLEKEFKAKNSKITELQNVKKNIVKSEKKLADMESELLKIDRQIPNAGRLSQFNMEIYYYIKAHNLKISNIEAKTKDTSQKNYGKQPIEISVAGKKQDILDLIDYFKESPIKTKITEFTANVMDVEDLTVNIKLNTFFSLKKGNNE